MADKVFQTLYTPGLNDVQYNVVLVGAGAAAPTFLVGDSVGVSAGALLTIARSGAGLYTATTVHPFPNVKGWDMNYAWDSSASNVVLMFYPVPSQITSAGATYGCWQFNFNLFVGGSLTDLTSTQQIALQFTFLNSISGP